MRRLTLIGLVAIILLALFGTPAAGPIAAQGSWSHTFDFSVATGGWTAIHGTYTGGRFQSETSSGNLDELVTISLSFASSTITSVRVVYTAGNAANTGYRTVVYPTNVLHGLQLGAGSFNTTINDTQNNVTSFLILVHTAGGGTPKNRNYIDLVEVNGTGTNPFGDQSTPTPTPAPVITGWTRPLKAPDTAGGDLASYGAVETAYTQFNDPTPYTGNQRLSIAYSSVAGAPVHNVYAGTVSNVAPAAPGSCALDIAVPSGYCEFWRSEPKNAFNEPRRFGLVDGVYIITVDLDSGLKIRYAVRNPTIRSGDTVAAGCILGYTFSVKEYFAVTGSAEVTYGVTLFQGIDGTDSFDVRVVLTDEPTGASCQAIATEDRPCRLVADSDFPASSTMWTFLAGPGGVAGIAPEGRGLLLKGTVQQPLNLDPGADYSITVVYRKLFANVRPFEVQLGTESPVSIIDSAESPDVQITYNVAADTYTPNSTGGGANIFWLSLMADPQLTEFQIRVDYICVSEAGEGEVQAPGGCLLYNYEFDSAVSDAWTLDPGTTLAQISGGMLFLGPTDASATQSLRLSPKGSGPQTYTITVRARRQGVPVTGESLDIIWAWGSFTGTFTSSNNTFVDFIDDFTVTTEAINDVTLTVDDTNSATSGVAQIDRVCITTSDGVVPPGYQGPPVIASACKVCAYSPVGDIDLDITEYVAWLACFLSQLWECAFKSVLAGIWTVLTNILTFLGFFRLWLGYVFEGSAAWANSNIQVVAMWFNGQFLNLGQRIDNGLINVRFGTVITSGGAGFWDALIAIANAIASLGTSLINGFRDVMIPVIELLGRIADGLFGLIGALLGIIWAIISLVADFIIGFIVNAIGLVLGFLQSLSNGINMTPTPILPEWVPNCADPQTGLFFVCTGIYVVEQSLLVGPAQYIIPIVIGLTAVNLLLWGVQEILSVFSGGAE